MTIEQARELLGEEVRGLTDEEIEKDAEVADLFKNIFFSGIKSWQK